MGEAKSDSFGPISSHMFEGPGWDLVEETARKWRAGFYDDARYVPGYGLKLPEPYKR